VILGKALEPGVAACWSLVNAQLPTALKIESTLLFYPKEYYTGVVI
jgi:hypothetical protein